MLRAGHEEQQKQIFVMKIDVVYSKLDAAKQSEASEAVEQEIDQLRLEH